MFRFVTCDREELVNIQLMQMNYVPEHSQDHADSYMSCQVDCKATKFIGNKLTKRQTNILTK